MSIIFVIQGLFRQSRDHDYIQKKECKAFFSCSSKLKINLYKLLKSCVAIGCGPISTSSFTAFTLNETGPRLPIYFNDPRCEHTLIVNGMKVCNNIDPHSRALERLTSHALGPYTL